MLKSYAESVLEESASGLCNNSTQIHPTVVLAPLGSGEFIVVKYDVTMGCLGYIGPRVAIGYDVEIGVNTCIIGENFILDNARIGNSVTVVRGTTIGHAATVPDGLVLHADVWPYTIAGGGSMVGINYEYISELHGASETCSIQDSIDTVKYCLGASDLDGGLTHKQSIVALQRKAGNHPFVQLAFERAFNGSYTPPFGPIKGKVNIEILDNFHEFISHQATPFTGESLS